MGNPDGYIRMHDRQLTQLGSRNSRRANEHALAGKKQHNSRLMWFPGAVADTGLAVGELRDPLCGQRVGVKPCRTECLRDAALPDSLSPDTDHVEQMRRQGWHTACLGPADDAAASLRRTVGEHRPEYVPWVRRRLGFSVCLVHNNASSNRCFRCSQSGITLSSNR